MSDADIAKITCDDLNEKAANVDGFDPVGNTVDRRLLFEVTGIKINDHEFEDESSDDQWVVHDISSDIGGSQSDEDENESLTGDINNYSLNK